MDLQEFWQQSDGKWFAQRTSYQLIDKSSENSKADFMVELLPLDDSTLINLSKSLGVDSAAVTVGVRMSWDSGVDWGKPKQTGSLVLAFVPEGSTTGKFLRQGDAQIAASEGKYTLKPDAHLILTVTENNAYTEEQIWFASENLRLRTTLRKEGDRFTHTAFYSEIRRLPPKPETSG